MNSVLHFLQVLHLFLKPQLEKEICFLKHTASLSSYIYAYPSTKHTFPTCTASIISFNSPKTIHKMKYTHPLTYKNQARNSSFPRPLLGQIELFPQKMVQLWDLRTAIHFCWQYIFDNPSSNEKIIVSFM